MRKAFLHDFYFVLFPTTPFLSAILFFFLCVWWKYLENITSLQKAITTNHLQNKLVHINCIFYSKWVADITLRMYKLSNVAAENKSRLEPSAGRDASGFGMFLEEPPFSSRGGPMEADLGCLVWRMPALVRVRSFLPCSPVAPGPWRGTLLGHPVAEPIGQFSF